MPTGSAVSNHALLSIIQTRVRRRTLAMTVYALNIDH